MLDKIENMCELPKNFKNIDSEYIYVVDNEGELIGLTEKEFNLRKKDENIHPKEILENIKKNKRKKRKRRRQKRKKIKQA